MKALLVYPEYPDTFWSFKTILKYLSKKAAFPPLGLLTLGALMPGDWDIKLVDVNVRPLSDEQIQWADMVFVGGMIVQKESAKDIIDRCKALGKTVVAGGPLFKSQREAFPGVDHFVLDEAEVTLPPFLEDLEKGTLKSVYTSDVKPDLSMTPIPAWHLVNFKDYVTMSVQYSRGCPFNCEFCDIIIMNGRVPRTKSPEQMIAEFDSLYQAGWRGGVFIVDDNFIGNSKRVKRMLPGLVEWQKKHRYPFQLMTEASVNLSDDTELMKLMSAANFHKVFLGIETPEPASLAECGKYQNASRDLAQAVQTIQGYGMQVLGGFIVGFDSDKESTFETQIAFIQQVGIVTAMVGLLNALPLTRLWHRLREEQRLLTETSGENTDGQLNFVPVMDKDTLIEGYQRIIRELYSRSMYYRRIQIFLKHYQPTVRGRLTFRDVKAFVRSLLQIGVFSSANYLYWKLLLRTALTKFRALPVAVELMITGEHFYRMSKRLIH